MTYRIVPFADEHLEEAACLFRGGYERERLTSPLLPPEPMGSAAALAEELRGSRRGPAVAAFRGGQMVGFMCTTARFDWKGEHASLCREHSHAATADDQRMVYQLMYAALAEEWVAAGSHIHLICHFAGDPVLHETVFRLGFGAVVAENLRDLSPVASPGSGGVQTAEESDLKALLAIAAEHGRYYRSSPVFLPKGEEDAAELVGQKTPGGTVFVYREAGEPAAYFVVGPCAGKGDGLLLRDTNTAQIRSAYARPAARSRGVGSALLARCVEWSRRKGYDRLYVEHETANIPGGSFWRKHFSPYLYASMRYVDSTV
jgi:GNAT superfamily N-acetyltransferase